MLEIFALPALKAPIAPGPSLSFIVLLILFSKISLCFSYLSKYPVK